jgi:Predicted membrane protein
MPSTAPASSRVDRVVRFAAKAAVVVLGSFFVLLLGIRVVVYPQLEAHRLDIARWLGERIGQPVEIDDIVTGWDGWNPRLSIRGFRVHDRSMGPACWTCRASICDRLDIAAASRPAAQGTDDRSPRLAVRRDTQGRLHLAGLEMPGDDHADDSPFANWVLRQPQVIVRDGLVAWDDEMRHAPQLLLDHVQFRLEQRFGRHQAGLTGVPPSEIAGPIDMRVDLTGMSRRDFSHVHGRLYFRLDYADVAAWQEWLPMPFAIQSGRGALRAWVDVADGQARGGVADLELADVRTALGNQQLAPLALAHLAGRAEWKQAPGHATFKANGLAFVLPDGSTFGPTDLTLALDEATTGADAGGHLAVGEIELQPLVSIASHLPLPDAVRRDIMHFAPHGSVHDARVEWTGELAAPRHYLIGANVRGFAVASHDGLPGVSGMAGSIEMTERGGRVHVAAGASTLALPRIFADPLTFDRLAGDVLWQMESGTTRVEWKGSISPMPTLAGTTDGTWRAAATDRAASTSPGN